MRQMGSSVSGIRDNHRRGTVGDFLKQHVQPGSDLSVVSAYFTIYAFEALKNELAAINRMRFLFGEPRFVSALDPDRSEKKAFKIEDEGLRLSNQLVQKRVARECAEWIAAKAEIRSVKQASLLHGKMYHIAHNGIEDAIVGSSNFTVRGLGLADAGNNIELNLEVDSNRDRRDLKAWFDELWNDLDLVADVRDEVLAYLAQLYQDNSPEFIYYKTLFHLFERYLSDLSRGDLIDSRTQFTDTAIWNTLFDFQKDGVKGAINKILTHGGCIIADSVGLGKTFEALAIVKYFELLNHKVLVLCPKKLRENWTVYQAQNNSPLNPFVNDRFAYTVLSHTDLSRGGGRSGDIDLSLINWGNYDLVVIDESHNFRNNTRGRRDEEGQVISRTRYERMMEDVIKAGIKTRVLMLSATPVNNDLKDLRNQLLFLTEDRDDAFQGTIGIASLHETLRAAQRTFNEWAKQRGERRTADLLERFSSAFFKLLDELTIARSRKHIERYYDIAQLGGFPVRLKPISVYPDIDLAQRFMSYDKINDEISKYQLSLFNPSRYVLHEFRERYETGRVGIFKQSDRENFLIGMMKVNFLKRLESSVHSFVITLDRTVRKIEDLEARIRRFQQFQAENPTLDFDEVEVDALDDEDLRDALQVGEKLTFQMAHLDVAAWLSDLQRDKDQLLGLWGNAQTITPERDAKLAELKRLIQTKVQHPSATKTGQPNRKALVFTAFADTAIYLYDALRSWARDHMGIHIALVTGGSVENKTTYGKNDFNHILTHFSPVSKQRAKMKTMPQDAEIDLLIATDCISEGQNLQDCDYLINYDIHWNPVRVIQRFGRIDRIGSINQAVQLVNFWPTADLDKYIALKARVEARMALVDVAATLEDNILSPEDVEDLITDELKYRDQQLRRLRDEVLDLEDVTEGVTLNEFTLDDFRVDLSRYLESNRQVLAAAPLGLCAVVPTDPAHPAIKPGVIYCLRQKGDSSGAETVNPLQPYFLVYVLDRDRAVRYTFAQPKRVLDIFRSLCAGKTQPYDELCALFDRQTQDGADMTVHSELLEVAVESIARTFKKRAVDNLLSGRGGALVDRSKQASETTDFELITWLIIQECDDAPS